MEGARIHRYDRPGLLLMCHGDFPDDFFRVAEHVALHQKCLGELDRLRDDARFYRPSADDDFTRLGRQAAAHVASGLGLDNLELSYLSLKSPGVRQAVYRAALKGPGRIICAGAAGLMMPGRGVSESLPYELKKIVRDNPALDLVLAPPAIEAGDVAVLVRRSLEHAFKGFTAAYESRHGADEALEDAGVVLICSHDYDALKSPPDAPGSFPGFSAMLSNMSKAAHGGGTGPSAGLMRGVASLVRGFHSVEAGFIDFALPDLRQAAARLVEAGSTHIIATGMPSLLYKHPFSFTGPSEAAESLRRAFPDTDIIYVKPDPEPIAAGVADLLMTRVLEAERSGTSFKGMLREH